jgi:hypothetical protein
VAVLSAICRQSGHKLFGADLHHVGMRGHRDGLRLRLSDPTPGSDPQNVPSGSLASEDSEEEGLEPQKEVGGDLNSWTWNRSVPVSTSRAVSAAEVTRRRTGYGRVIANRSRGSSVSIVSGYGLDDRTISGFDPRQRRKDFSSSLCVQTGSEAHPASFQMGTVGPFHGAITRLGRDADH